MKSDKISDAWDDSKWAATTKVPFKFSKTSMQHFFKATCLIPAQLTPLKFQYQAEIERYVTRGWGKQRVRRSQDFDGCHVTRINSSPNVIWRLLIFPISFDRHRHLISLDVILPGVRLYGNSKYVLREWRALGLPSLSWRLLGVQKQPDPEHLLQTLAQWSCFYNSISLCTSYIFHNVSNTQGEFSLEACDVTKWLVCHKLSIPQSLLICSYEQYCHPQSFYWASSTISKTFLYNACKYVSDKQKFPPQRGFRREGQGMLYHLSRV